MRTDATRAYQAKWARENRAKRPEHVRAQRRTTDNEYRRTKAGWAVWALSKLRARAKARGDTDFDLEVADLQYPDVCPVLGIPIYVGRGGDGSFPDNSPSVDRFDNARGYTKDNIRIISGRANRLKSDSTTDELRAILAYMEPS